MLVDQLANVETALKLARRLLHPLGGPVFAAETLDGEKNFAERVLQVLDGLLEEL